MNTSIYKRNKAKARTVTKLPSLTDQSAANASDINVILKRQRITGTVPGPAQQPISGDFSQLPVGLRDFIHEGRRLEQLRNRLPPQLKDMLTEELLSLSTEQLQVILAPPADKPADKPKQGDK